MAVVYKVLGQSAPANTAETTVYTVPASTYAIISQIIVTALDATRPTVTIDVRPNATAAANATKLVKDAVISPGRAHSFGRGITLDATDLITLTVSAGNEVSMQVFGTEIDA